MLVERQGEIVSREDIRQGIWSADTFVEFDNSLAVAIRKIRDALRDDADLPQYVETVPRRGYRFLATAVVVESVPSRPAAAEPSSPSAATPEPLAPHPIGQAGPPPATARASRYLLIAVLVVLFAGGAIYTLRSTSRHSRANANVVAVSPPRIRRSVAILGFRNLPGRKEDLWLSPALAEMLNTELASDGSLRLVAGEDIARVKREWPLRDEETLSKTTLARLKTDPGADYVVLGSYTPLPAAGDKRIRLDIRVQDTTRGETIVEQSFTGSEANIFDLAVEAGRSLRHGLGAGPASEQDIAQAKAALPVNQEAIRYYVEGRQRMWDFDTLLARDLLIKAIAADPASPLAHSALAEAWSHLGYAQKARAEAERARALSEHLRTEDRLAIEGQYYAILPDHAKAIETYQKLFTQFPDNLDYGLHLADEQRFVSAKDADRTLNMLRQLPPPAGQDPRIDMVDARAWVQRDSAKGAAAARRALERAQAQGSPWLVGRAYGFLCMFQENDQVPEVAQDCEKATEIYRAAGDLDAAARHMNDLAAFYISHGKLEQAEKLFQKALGIFRQVGDIEGTVTASGNLGSIAYMEGNLEAAARSFAETLPGYKELDDKDGIALTLNNLGDVARRGGDLKLALARYQEAEGSAKSIDDKFMLGYIWTGIGDVLSDRADFKAARDSYQQALQVRTQAGMKQFAAETEVQISRLSIQEGKYVDVEAILRRCKDQFHADAQPDDELQAGTALIEALISENRLTDAARLVEDAKPLAAKSLNEIYKLEFSLASARVALASGDLHGARGLLDDALQRASSRRLLGIELETKLTLAEGKQKAGQKAAARTDFLSLQRIAHEKGFELLARKAASQRDAS